MKFLTTNWSLKKPCFVHYYYIKTSSVRQVVRLVKKKINNNKCLEKNNNDIRYTTRIQ